MNIVIVSGGFDPLTDAHISYFEAARELGEILIVACNSDDWLRRKKGTEFMNISVRRRIISSLKMVDKTIEFDDSDDSAIDAIRQVQQAYPNDKIIFANGGDQTKDTIPEMVCLGVEFKFGVGGDSKTNSSSWILNRYSDHIKAGKDTERVWGKYSVLNEYPYPLVDIKTKFIEVQPGKSLSLQRHEYRNEFWIVCSGLATITLTDVVDEPKEFDYSSGEFIYIPRGAWHQLKNNTDSILKVFEVQYGSKCEEGDIERYEK